MTLSLALLLYFCFQQDLNPENKVETLPPGTEVNLDSFRLIVPDGARFVDESQAHKMTSLTGATHIPNCMGLMVASRGDFQFVVVIQHFPFLNYRLGPEVDQDFLDDFFKKKHLYRMSDVEPSSATIIESPWVDHQEETFSVTMSYMGDDGNASYYRKKIWTSSQDTLMFSMRATQEGWALDEDLIEAIFQSVIRRDAPNLPTGEVLVDTYLNLLGMQISVESNQPEGVSSMVYLVSGLLVVFAILILVFAVKRFKKEQGTLESSEDLS